MKKIALQIIQKLQKAGFTALLAGGCVRDMLMGKEPKDFDIVTSAKPDQIEKLLEKTIPVGKKFGVMLAVVRGRHFEIATFRSEGKYTDKRRPDKVFWASAKEDAVRRDFTINGMFYDPTSGEVLDFVGGQEDLKKKILRFIGEPEKRIQEDNLRILRAVRFKNILGFDYDLATLRALQNNARLVNNISAERIRDELNKMLADKSRAQSISDLSKIGVLKHILAEVELTKGVNQPPQFHSEGDVFTHTILSLAALPAKTPQVVSWAILLHDIGKPPTYEVRHRITFYRHTKLGAEMADEICRRLKFSKEEREKVVFLVENHLRHKDIMRMKVARQRRWVSHPWFGLLLQVFYADGLASYPVNLELYNFAKKLYQEEKKRPAPLPKLLTGNDLMKEFGLKPGPKIGKMLKAVEDAQLEGKIKTKKEALEYIKGLKINR